MTERQGFEAAEHKRRRLAIAGYRCEVCGGRGWQLAHRIPQTKANLRKYGPAIIHHDRNLAVTCAACNQRVIVHGIDEDRLIESIKGELWRRK